MDKTFLIIDDDPAVCKMLELLIRSNGLGRVVCVLHSGEIGRASCRERV